MKKIIFKKQKFIKVIISILCLFMMAFVFFELKTYAITLDDFDYDEKEYIAVCNQVRDFNDGGKDYIYIIDGIKNHCYVPPAEFNPLNADDEALARYGFPARPKDKESAEYNDWFELMKNYKYTSEPVLHVVERNINEMFNEENENTIINHYSLNWSGYLSNLGSSSSVYYNQVQMDYIEPTINSVKEGVYNINSYWVGIGGYNSGKLVQAGTSTNGLSTHSAWFEYISPNDIDTCMVYFNLTVNSGDSMHIYISYQRANNMFNYYIANNTTGQSFAGCVELSTSDYYDGTTAEWVVERCSVNNNIVALGEYGELTLNNCKATINTSNDWIDVGETSGLTKLIMKNSNGITLSSPNNIYSNNNFNCIWYNYE